VSTGYRRPLVEAVRMRLAVKAASIEQIAAELV